MRLLIAGRGPGPMLRAGLGRARARGSAVHVKHLRGDKAADHAGGGGQQRRTAVQCARALE
jgi:hypothetical protein